MIWSKSDYFWFNLLESEDRPIFWYYYYHFIFIFSGKNISRKSKIRLRDFRWVNNDSLAFLKAEEKKRLAKLKAKEAADKKKAEKEAQRRIPASQLFTSQTDKFSKFDDTVRMLFDI